MLDLASGALVRGSVRLVYGVPGLRWELVFKVYALASRVARSLGLEIYAWSVRVWPWGNLVAPMLHLGLGAHVRGLVLGEP